MSKNAIYATLSAPTRTTLRFVGYTRMSRVESLFARCFGGTYKGTFPYLAETGMCL